VRTPAESIATLLPALFDVVAHRLKYEYGVDCQFETINIATARWITGSDKDIEQLIVNKNKRC
jgi:peptide subunit release factor RF-3